MSEPGSPPPPPSDQTPPVPPPAPPAKERNNVMIVLSYLGILALVPLLVEKEDQEVQWHAKHGLVLTAAWIILYIALTVIGMALGAVTAGVGGCLIVAIELLLVLAIIVIHLMCIVKGINGEKFLIPGISQYADKF